MNALLRVTKGTFPIIDAASSDADTDGTPEPASAKDSDENGDAELSHDVPQEEGEFSVIESAMLLWNQLIDELEATHMTFELRGEQEKFCPFRFIVYQLHTLKSDSDVAR